MTGFDTFTQPPAASSSGFCADESGATAIEYAMVASGVGVVIVDRGLRPSEAR